MLMEKRMKKEAPFSRKPSFLKAPAATLLLLLPSLVLQLGWGGFKSPPRAGEVGAVEWVVLVVLLQAVPEGSMYSSTTTCLRLLGAAW